MKSRMAGFERDTLAAVWNSKRVWLIHVFANALILTAFFYWLRIDEGTGVHIAITVFMGAAVLLCAMWLHCATLDYFHRTHSDSSASFSDSMRATLPRVPAFLLWALLFGYVLYVIGSAGDYDAQVGGYSRHLLPMFLRSHVSPRGMTSAFVAIIFFLFYFLWPILFLPIGSQVARFNFRGFIGRPLLNALRPLRELRFWALFIVCFVVGMYVPYLLANVDPKEHASLHYQTTSMVARLGIGYLLLITAWIIVCSAMGRVIESEPHTEIAETVAEPFAPMAQ